MRNPIFLFPQALFSLQLQRTEASSYHGITCKTNLPNKEGKDNKLPSTCNLDKNLQLSSLMPSENNKQQYPWAMHLQSHSHSIPSAPFRFQQKCLVHSSIVLYQSVHSHVLDQSGRKYFFNYQYVANSYKQCANDKEDIRLTRAITASLALPLNSW